MNSNSIRKLLIASFALVGIFASAAEPVSLERAQALAASSPSNQGFAIIVNESVLVQLNRYLSKAASRKALRRSLDRMETMRSMLETEAQSAGAPWELMAIALVESTFKNPPETANKWKSAGIWQFTRGSARVHGLTVGPKLDERLDPQKSTRAALHYLKANFETLGSWPLAILAYNGGLSKVKKGIAQHSSDDAFKLVEAGFKGGDRDYLAKIMAAALIIKNPSLLD